MALTTLFGGPLPATLGQLAATGGLPALPRACPWALTLPSSSSRPLGCTAGFFLAIRPLLKCHFLGEHLSSFVYRVPCPPLNWYFLIVAPCLFLFWHVTQYSVYFGFAYYVPLLLEPVF